MRSPWVGYAFAAFLCISISAHGQEKQGRSSDELLSLLRVALGRFRSFDVLVETRVNILFRSEIVKPAYRDEAGVYHRAVLKSRKLLPGEGPQVRAEFSHQIYRGGKGRIEILDGKAGKPLQIVTYDQEGGRLYDLRAREAIVRTPARATADGGDYREGYRCVFQGLLDLLVCLEQRRNYLTIKQPNTDSELVSLRAEQVPAANASSTSYHRSAFEVELNPRRGMMPGARHGLQTKRVIW